MGPRMECWPNLERPPQNVELLWLAQRGWRADELQISDWMISFPKSLAEEVCAIATESCARGLPLTEALKTWSRPAAAVRLQDQIENVLEGGIGFSLLRGLEPTGNEEIDNFSILLVGSLFGSPVSQTKLGNRIARVEDNGLDLKDPHTRGHKTSAELAFHCDRADRVILYCIRPALSGGRSRIISSLFLADALRAKHPHLAARLFQDAPQDRRGEQAVHEQPWSMLPIFSCPQGSFVARYLRRFVTDSQRHPGAPPLDHVLFEAMKELDRLMEQDGLALEMPFEPGDIQIINNNVVLHARTAFADLPGMRSQRLLLRVWLSHQSARPLPDSFADLYGSVGAGAYRGGVWPTEVTIRSALATH